VVISPDGRSVYTAGTGASTIGEFNVGSGGELTPKTVASVPDGAETYDVTISPNGRNAYAPDCEGNNVRQYSIGAGGELAPLTPATVAAGRCPEFLWMTADGASAYAPSFSDADVNQYNVSTTGALTPKSPATAPAGAGAGDVVIPPDQGPVAAFTDPTARVGQTVQFDGSGSSDSDGTVARYDWSFGDGTTDPDGGPKVSHVYTKAGTYSVTLTVTDDSGCSTALVFTGQTAYCNASPGATLTRTVTIAAVKPKPSKLTARPRHAQAGKRTCFRFTFSSRGHGVRGATVRFAGHTAHTSRRGAARICLALHRGTYTARASKHGYRSARATVRITAAPRKAPAFTG
jgi:PKD repeat protein